MDRSIAGHHSGEESFVLVEDEAVDEDDCGTFISSLTRSLSASTIQSSTDRSDYRSPSLIMFNKGDWVDVKVDNSPKLKETATLSFAEQLQSGDITVSGPIFIVALADDKAVGFLTATCSDHVRLIEFDCVYGSAIGVEVCQSQHVPFGHLTGLVKQAGGSERLKASDIRQNQISHEDLRRLMSPKLPESVMELIRHENKPGAHITSIIANQNKPFVNPNAMSERELRKLLTPLPLPIPLLQKYS